MARVAVAGIGGEPQGAPLMRARAWLRRHRASVAVGALLVAYVALVVKDAWVSDDAYITFRSVYNLLHGFGPTWNTDERVQAFTHPLWMLLLSGATALLRDPYWASLLLSFACSAATAAIVVFRIARSSRRAVVALLLLCGSKAYLDFSTSSLENPLTNLLLAAFAWVYLQRAGGRYHLVLLAALAGLAALNRMDAMLLFLPALAAEVLASVRAQAAMSPTLDHLSAAVRAYAPPALRAARILAVGFTPLLIWCLFALWYYGSPVPNTALAKLHSGMSESLLLLHGVAYVGSSFLFDPLLLLTILVGLRLPFAERSRPGQWLALGGLLYVAYTVWIGGDFMAGRFFTAPFLVAVILLASQPMERLAASSPAVLVRSALPLSLAAIAALALFTPFSRWLPDTQIPASQTAEVTINQWGIADERDFYLDATGIWTIGLGPTTPRATNAAEGQALRTSDARVVVAGAIGFLGYEAGPHVHIIDVNVLADPFMARLPAFGTRIGHFERAVPSGYVETWLTGQDDLTNPRLALFYSKLRVVTQGNLFDPARLIAIWRLDTGQYDYLLAGYHSPTTTPLPHVTVYGVLALPFGVATPCLVPALTRRRRRLRTHPRL